MVKTVILQIQLENIIIIVSIDNSSNAPRQILVPLGKKTVESLWSITTEADSEMSQSCDLAHSVQAAGSKRAKRRVS